MSDKTPLPSEQVSELKYSLIDYLSSVPGREVDKDVRIANTEQCRDADYIPKVVGAGDVVDGRDGQYQIMHNGIKVGVDGYYGPWVTKSIKTLNGHHEPQEEKVFYEVSKRFRPNTWMIELGSYWAYYSLWFHQATKNAKNICCEPDPENKKIGIKNAKLNSFTDFYFVDSAAGCDDGKMISFDAEHVEDEVHVPIRSVDSLVDQFGVDTLEVLHMDVQGAELDSLYGAEKTIKAGKLRFVFVSTHHYLISRNPSIHQDCIDFIKKLGGHIICEHDIHESFSGDGLIVASFHDDDKDFTVEVSRHRMAGNQFRSYTKDLTLSFEAYDYILNRIALKNEDLIRLNERVRGLEKDIEYLNNLPIRHSLKVVAKSVGRSAKYRATKAIWGEKHLYMPDDNLRHLVGKKLKTKKDTLEAIDVIVENDTANLPNLIRDPHPLRVAAYETLRDVSHMPRRVVKKIREGMK